jgi:hypothetical protein
MVVGAGLPWQHAIGKTDLPTGLVTQLKLCMHYAAVAAKSASTPCVKRFTD